MRPARKSLSHTGHCRVGAGRSVLAAYFFRAALLSCAVAILKASALLALLVIRWRHCLRSWASDSHVTVLRLNALSEALRVSLNLCLSNCETYCLHVALHTAVGFLESGMREMWLCSLKQGLDTRKVCMSQKWLSWRACREARWCSG